MKGHKGLHHRKAGGPIKDESVKHGLHHDKADGKHTKPGGSTGKAEGNKRVLAEAHEGLKGGGHIAGGSHGKGLGRKRGGRAHGGGVGADTHPFSSAHKHGGKCD
jgi:hypothetical protein